MRYAIFDFDGTLVDSMTMWRGVGKAFLEQNGYPPLKYQKPSDNDKWEKDFLGAVNEQLGIKVTYDDFYNWFSKYVFDQYAKYIPLKPTAYEFLEKLYNQGVKMCLCSSTHREMMEPALKRMDLEKFFEFTCHCGEFGKEKNEPDIFMHCMEKLGAKKPSEVAVFEDALYAAETAHKAGFYTVGIYDVTEQKSLQLKEFCDQYITGDYTQIEFDKLPE